MNKDKQLFKAQKWLNRKCGKNAYPVVAVRDGYAQFVGYVFHIEREGKPKLRYVMNLNNNEILGIKRICIK